MEYVSESMSNHVTTHQTLASWPCLSVEAERRCLGKEGLRDRVGTLYVVFGHSIVSSALCAPVDMRGASLEEWRAVIAGNIAAARHMSMWVGNGCSTHHAQSGTVALLR